MTEPVETDLRDLRWSTEHDGWFWDAKIPDPLAPGSHLYRSGYARKRRTAVRHMNRAIYRVHRTIKRGQRETA